MGTGQEEDQAKHCREGHDQADYCLQCGLCCKIFGDRITPAPENLFSWMEDGRGDVLRFFMACLDDGRWVWCNELSPRDISGIHVVEMRDPSTGGFPTVCPFLRRVAKDRYICSIHELKPEMCRNYQPWVWGETYFNRCPGLKRKKESRWLECQE
ncbi:MAG TPA: YkgJ family cysteine cluster protein [Methanolinea sp.]|nr:YkgJ family cysteine cluster protein [Methanolinea sp.]